MIRAAVIVFISLLLAAPLSARDPRPTGPFYNPATKSYFQLFRDNDRNGRWHAAQELASRKFYKNVPGRLAVIDSPETHQFLLERFQFDWTDATVWIGLRYWCNGRVLQWEGQRPFSPSSADHFRLWHAEWSRTGEDLCGGYATGRSGYAPVYYRNIGGSVRWQAVGAGKGFATYLVEYPTGGE